MNTQEESKNMISDLENTHPIGHDTDGEYTITMGDDGNYFPDHLDEIDQDYVPFTALMGVRYSTKEQAQQKAYGLNAKTELVMAIHNCTRKERENGGHISGINHNLDCTIDIWIPDKVLEKLGEKKIKRALEWGM